MSDAYLFELREQFAEQVAAQFDFVFVEVEVLAQTPTEAIATASTEDQTVVGSALAVGDLAAAFTEGLALAQANLLPGGLWQRLGGHQQALYWQLVFAQWRQAGGVTLHGRYHPLAANLCQRGTHLARLPVDGRGIFVDRYAQRLHCPGKAAHQLGWLDGRRVRAVNGSKRIADPQLAPQLLGAQPAVVVLGHALAIQVVEVGAQAAFLLRVARRAIKDAAFAVVAVDAFALQHVMHFIRDAVQQVDAGAALLRREGAEQAVFAEQVAHQPAPITAGGAEAGDLGFNHRDVQLGAWRLR